MKIFETLYALYGRIDREGERVELVLGDGILSWRRDEGSIYHPILLQRSIRQSLIDQLGPGEARRDRINPNTSRGDFKRLARW